MPFRDPSAGGDKMPLDQLEGALLLVSAKENVPEMMTSFGPSTAVRADVAVLDGVHNGAEYVDTLIFPKMLQSQLRGAIGEQVIGRLAKGKPKPGQSAPWLLNPATEADKTLGERYVATTTARAVADESPF